MEETHASKRSRTTIMTTTTTSGVLRRKPLADLTNAATAAATTSSSLKSLQKPNPKSKPDQIRASGGRIDSRREGNSGEERRSCPKSTEQTRRKPLAELTNAAAVNAPSSSSHKSLQNPILKSKPDQIRASGGRIESIREDNSGEERRSCPKSTEQTKRKPLEDLSNASSLKSLKIPMARRKVDQIKAGDGDMSRSVESSREGRRVLANSTEQTKEVSANSDVVSCDKASLSTVSTQHSTELRRNKGKEVAVVERSSCPPVGRFRSIMDSLEMAREDSSLKVCSVSLPKPKKKRRYRTDMTTQKLPQDFIEEQKAYFAEIDAFELPQEVVSESELE